MASPYRQIFAVPGTTPFTLAALAARTAHLMTILSIFFFIPFMPATAGSYRLAGELSAAYALAYSLASPFVSRLASRGRPGRVLLTTAIMNTVARAGFLAAAWTGTPAWIAIALAAASGASMPAAGPLARARWTRLLADPALRHAALSFESVMDESILVTVPILVAALATAVAPAAALIAALALAALGNTALAAQAARPPGGSPRPARGTPWSVPGFPALILAFALVGAAQTIIDLSTVAFAAQHQARALSGLVLATIALASAASGLRYGHRAQRRPPHRRLPAALGLLACAMLPFAAAPGIWFLIPAAVLLGLTVAPAVIAGFSTVSLAVPADQVTEGLTWITAALGIGISLGSAAAGALAGGWGPRAAFACAAGCAGAAALAVLPVRRRGSPRPRWPAARPGSAG